LNIANPSLNKLTDRLIGGFKIEARILVYLDQSIFETYSFIMCKLVSYLVS